MNSFEYLLIEAAYLVLLLSGIPLVVSMMVGFFAAALQASTQIQEQTLTFVPKWLAVVSVFYLLGEWMLELLLAFSRMSLEDPAQFTSVY